ncbi:hypothetical protein FRC12_021692 [Ceratobasidium sp. 428]|nr:hypothetical protein FRC12_021692 [Ceratobasidium sp. 428]
MTVTAGTGCWSGLRALVKGRKSTREHNTTEQNTTRQSSLLKKLNDHPPAYDSHKADNANATHLSGYCNWSTLEQKPVLGCVGELKLPSREAADTSDHTIDGLSSALREVSLKIHDHPELGWNVGYAHDILTDFLEEQGFAVTRNYLADKLPGNTA